MPDRAAEPPSFVVAQGPQALPPELRGAVVAIGNFDGVHLGHRHLLDVTLGEARHQGVPAVVVTFEPHPRSVFRPEKPVFRLTPAPSKARILEALGFGGMVVIPFDRAFAAVTAGAFVEDILRRALSAKTVVVGYNFHFGKDREGTPAFLEAAGRHAGFNVRIVPPAADEAGEPYSSYRIRLCLEQGDIAGANALLGYRWFSQGVVIHGDERGRALGFPTANVRPAADSRLRFGIYAVRLRRPDGSLFDGVASYGRRPTFDDGAPLLEAHLFDFSGSLYGETVEVIFFGWIRPEARFDSAEALVAQMHLDAFEAKRLLAAATPGTELDRLLAKHAWRPPA